MAHQPSVSGAFGRRSFLKGAGGATATLVSLSAFGKLVSEAFAQSPPTFPPREARTPEAGLAEFVAKWEVAGPAILLTRFGRFLSNRIFNCHVAGSPRAYHLILGAAGASLNPGTNPFAHANMVLSPSDWNAILYGDLTGLAPLLAGRAWFSRDEANRAALLAIVMYVFAHIPGGPNNDPRQTARVLQDLFERRGLPECEGEPETLEVVADLENDGQGTVEEILLGANEAPAVTLELARWVHDVSYGDIPQKQIQAAKDQLKNILAVTYAGSTMDPGLTFAGAVKGFGDKREATVIGNTRFRTSARHAAMANSFLAQILEWEDWTFLTHSGAAIIPVVLAVGEAEQASGSDVLTAIVAGNEILARAGEFLTDVLHTGNAQAVHQMELPFLAGKLMGLSIEEMQDASGIACTQPQVTSIPAWTAGAKGLLTGAPAYTAVFAAGLARQGLSGRRDLLENPLGYFYRVSDVGSPRRLRKALEGLKPGADMTAEDLWRFSREYFNKRYPTDGFQLPAVHAMLKVRKSLVDAGVDPKDPNQIQRIVVRIPLVMAATATMFRDGSDPVGRVRDPGQPDWTYIALLFDGPWPLAAALYDGELTHRQYQDLAIDNDDIVALANRIELVPDVSMGVFGAEVAITTASGEHREFVACIREDVNGDPGDPITPDTPFTPDDKFHIAASDVIKNKNRRDQILEAINNLESYGNIRDFMELL